MIETAADYIGAIPGRRRARSARTRGAGKCGSKRWRRRAPCSLARLVRTCRSAPAVWVALCDMADARGSTIVTPTRLDIAEATGIARVATISAALSALECCGWLERCHVPVDDAGCRRATLLRIVLRRTERKALCMKRSAVWSEKRSRGTERKTRHDFSYREGAASHARAFEGGTVKRVSANGSNTTP
jgi:hypothetical protein